MTLLSRLSLLALFALVLVGCDRDPRSVSATPPPPPTVIAAPAQVGTVEDEADFIGRVVAIDKVELRARVQGFLQQRAFTEGQTVAIGALLFQIEPEPYEAIVVQRQADLAKAQADEINANAQLKRGQELLAQKNIAQSRVDELQAAESIAQAGIAQARAALAAAELDLSYTRIAAPVAGRIGLANYTVGNLVGPSSGPLATIVSRDPIHVRFPVTQRELLEARRRIEDDGGEARDLVAHLRLPDGSTYEHAGHLDFVDVTTDPGTDSVTLRVQIPNPDGILVDGQYVGVSLQTSEPTSAILIPQSALQVDQQGVFVLIVDADRKAQVRRLQTGANHGSNVVVTQGLTEGELVIVEGIQKVRPGEAVIATPPQTLQPPEAAVAIDTQGGAS